MFSFFKRRRPDVTEALVNQTIGGQSVIYRLFRETLSCEDLVIRRLELTYFAASVMSFTYLSFGKQANREAILDDFARRALTRSLPSSREQVRLSSAVAEYQQRHAEYGRLLPLLFNPARATNDNPAATLMLHVFECVTRTSARPRMLEIAMASGLMQQFVADHIDFVRAKL
jgi:hypothetical protein